METVKSGKLKDAGNPFRDMTPEDRAYWQALIDRVHGQFMAAVAEGRDPRARRGPEDRRRAGRSPAPRRRTSGSSTQLGNFYDAVELAKQEAKLAGEPHLVYPPDERSRFIEDLLGRRRQRGGGRGPRAARARRQAAQAPGLYFLAR